MRSEKCKSPLAPPFIKGGEGVFCYSLFALQYSLLAVVVPAGEPADELARLPAKRAAYVQTLPTRATYLEREKGALAARAKWEYYADKSAVYIRSGAGDDLTLMTSSRYYRLAGCDALDVQPVRERVARFSAALSPALAASFGRAPALRNRVVILYGTGFRLPSFSIGLLPETEADSAGTAIFPVWLHETCYLEGDSSFSGGRFGKCTVGADGWLLKNENGTTSNTLAVRQAYGGGAPEDFDAGILPFCADTWLYLPHELEEIALGACLSVLLNALADAPINVPDASRKIERVAAAAFAAVLEEYYIEPAVVLASAIIADFLMNKVAEFKGKQPAEASRALDELLSQHINAAGRTLALYMLDRAGGIGLGPLPELEYELKQAVLGGFSQAYGATAAPRIAGIVRWRLRELVPPGQQTGAPDAGGE